MLSLNPAWSFITFVFTCAEEAALYRLCCSCFGASPAVTTGSIHGSLWGAAGQSGLFSRRNSLCGDKSVL